MSPPESMQEPEWTLQGWGSGRDQAGSRQVCAHVREQIPQVACTRCLQDARWRARKGQRAGGWVACGEVGRLLGGARTEHEGAGATLRWTAGIRQSRCWAARETRDGFPRHGPGVFGTSRETAASHCLCRGEFCGWGCSPARVRPRLRGKGSVGPGSGRMGPSGRARAPRTFPPPASAPVAPAECADHAQALAVR